MRPVARPPRSRNREADELQARACKQRASCEQAARRMPTSSMARHQWAAKLAKRPTIGCRPQPEGAGGIRKPTDNRRAHKGSLLRYRDAERRDGAQTPSRLRFGRGRGHSVWEGRRRFAYGRGSGSVGAPAFVQEHGSGSTPAFFVCARKRNVRTRGCRSAPAVSCKWHETELSGGGSRYIGEAENGRKLNLPSLDPLDSMLSDSESSISCPKSSHEQVEKLGKFEILSKIRARLFRDSESSKSCPPPDEKSQRRAFGAFLAGPSSRSALRGIG